MEESNSPMFSQTMYIVAPASRVWAALVTPADVAKYYLCPLQTIELHAGGRIVYGAGGREFIRGSVIEAVPDSRLLHTFRFMPETHGNVDNDGESRVDYSIKPMGAMCRLTLTHEGFGSDSQTCVNVSEGWPTILSALKTYLETGMSIAWPTENPGG